MSNFNENSSKTKSGIRPESYTFSYQPTTREAQIYLQSLIDRSIKTWNNSKDQNGDPLPKIGNIEITLATVVLGHKKPGKKGKIKGNHFTPFLLILPLEAQPDFSPALHADEWIGFFEQERNINEQIGKKANLVQPIDKIVKAFGYNSFDTEEGLLSYRNSKSREFYQKYNIKNNSREFKYIISLSKPRLVHFSDTESRVAVLIDPLRLLSDMAKRIDVGDETVYIKDVKSVQLKDTNYRYFIEAKNVKKNGKDRNKSNNFYHTLSQKDLNILTRNF